MLGNKIENKIFKTQKILNNFSFFVICFKKGVISFLKLKMKFVEKNQSILLSMRKYLQIIYNIISTKISLEINL